ncbi:TetR/AcrR family transcriptional regulator [Zavarzinia compransoris]|uniref:TetR/AcrR family transcriptional regulator n=1 Tax=Zavarzinia marina TaxID=2911065 RepID=UPI001F160E28|nr:TetR/AcrR family transcriptional regulator [Zavarzinia marina]MCF4164990.1 TetR/AcrR family transcriptional regulator [Zavarzinia marina]
MRKRSEATRRSEAKEAARTRILGAGAARIRGQGLEGAAIAPIMRDAGLTHGTFYAHFPDKDDLVAAAFRHALSIGRPAWTEGADADWDHRLARLARHYLTEKHRDTPEEGCAFAALGADAARAPDGFRHVFGEELEKSVEAVAAQPGNGPDAGARRADAIRLLALCIGGMTLARGVGPGPLSDEILRVCRDALALKGESDDQ